MTYDETRDSEQLRLLNPAIDRFIDRYKHPQASLSPCRRQTVFFFPGGMASRLVRAPQRYQDGVGLPPDLTYDPIWPSWELFLGNWRKLKMHRDSVGCFRDEDDRIIVANGAVGLGSFTPHRLFELWCRANHADLFVFGWDWRRRLDETVAFFLDRFLPHFQTRVTNAGCPDPLADFSLVGHSFGGMIANLILRSGHPLVANMARAITVATPAYGYAGQLHRWFEGVPWLLAVEVEFLESLGLGFLADAARRDMLELISSLPALYTLHFLDEPTFAAAPPTLGADPGGFSLASYPSIDATVPSLRADAYHPQTSGSLVRYPVNTGFDLSELGYAATQFQQLAAPMSAAMSQKFYNIRGVSTKLDGTVRDNTVGAVKWAWISPVFNPTDPSPIADDGMVPGDGTQPAWSARLATNAVARCIDVKDVFIEHTCMMNHPKVIQKIAQILCQPVTIMPQPLPLLASAPASDKEVRDFLRWLYTQRDRKKWPRFDAKLRPDFLPPEFKDRFPAIAFRIFKDLVRGPVSRKKKKPPSGGGKRTRRPKQRKPATQKR